MSATRTTRTRRSGPSARPDQIVEHLGRHLDPGLADGLLRAAGGGDQAAFARLFDSTAPVILGCLRRALNGPGEAELITQRVYVQLWRTAPRFRVATRSALAQLLLVTRAELIRWHHGQRRTAHTPNPWGGTVRRSLVRPRTVSHGRPASD